MCAPLVWIYTAVPLICPTLLSTDELIAENVVAAIYAAVLTLLYVVPPALDHAVPLAQKMPLLTVTVLALITLAPEMLPYAPVVVMLEVIKLPAVTLPTVVTLLANQAFLV